jgi:DNA-binding MarR family transcriptional regulator
MAATKNRLSKEPKATAAGKELWFRAMRWRREVDRELAGASLTYTQWLVLEAIEDLTKELRDAVSQSAIAVRIELDKMTVSQVMRTLCARNLADRAPAVGRPAYRVILTARGRRAVQEGRVCVEAASRRCLEELAAR